jgi:hypothetical protein
MNMLSILFAMAMAGEAPNTAKPEPDRVICRREAQIGSLVRRKKVCRTEAEWRAVAQESKDMSNGIQKRSGEITNPG